MIGFDGEHEVCVAVVEEVGESALCEESAHSGESDHRFRWKVISDSGAK